MSGKTSRDWDDSDVIGSACARLPDAINYLKHAIAVHETNNILLRSSQISSQIPKSKAAWIFNSLHNSQWRYEILSISRLWDKEGNRETKHRLSIPTFIYYLCNDEIIEKISENAYNRTIKTYTDVIGDPNRDSLDVFLEETHRARAQENAIRDKKLAKCRLQAIRKYHESNAFKARLKKFTHIRDEKIAHALYNEQKEIPPDLQIVDGDEKWLLDRSIKILNWLTSAVMGLNYSVDAFQINMKECAQLFWDGVQIKVKG